MKIVENIIIALSIGSALCFYLWRVSSLENTMWTKQLSLNTSQVAINNTFRRQINMLIKQSDNHAAVILKTYCRTKKHYKEFCK